MPQRDHPASNHAGQPHDDFRRISGIGPTLERSLHDSGILTYQDLAERTPEEIAAVLTDMARVSPQRIEKEDWRGQARQLAASLVQPSEPSQRYASFHIELLLNPDNSVRRTKVHHHQTDTDDAWAGMDEDRLLAFLRDRVPPSAVRQPTQAADLQPAPPTTSQPSVAAPTASLPPSFLRIEELTPVRTDEQTSVRLTARIDPPDDLGTATFDLTADIAAHSKLGDDQRWSLDTAHGAIRGNEPLTLEVTGPPLPLGLYRLVATVAVYPADHTPEVQPLYRRTVPGDLVQVTEAAIQTTPAGPDVAV
jgi:Helix-hairpin-helix domain